MQGGNWKAFISELVSNFKVSAEKQRLHKVIIKTKAERAFHSWKGAITVSHACPNKVKEHDDDVKKFEAKQKDPTGTEFFWDIILFGIWYLEIIVSSNNYTFNIVSFSSSVPFHEICTIKTYWAFKKCFTYKLKVIMWGNKIFSFYSEFCSSKVLMHNLLQILVKRCWSIPFNGLPAEFQKNEIKIFSLRSLWIFDTINQMLINAGVVHEQNALLVQFLKFQY